jgi:hypothetical protein
VGHVLGRSTPGLCQKPGFLFYLISTRIFWRNQPVHGRSGLCLYLCRPAFFRSGEGRFLKMYMQQVSMIVNGRSIRHYQFPIAIGI